jgi:hypothetical protein
MGSGWRESNPHSQLGRLGTPGERQVKGMPCLPHASAPKLASEGLVAGARPRGAPDLLSTSELLEARR